MSLGKRIKTLRKAMGLTQAQLSGRVGIHQSSLSELERGDTKHGSSPTILALALALNTNPEWLQTGEGSPAPNVKSDIDESEVVALYKALSPELRSAWMASGRAMLAQQKPSIAQPFRPLKTK